MYGTGVADASVLASVTESYLDYGESFDDGDIDRFVGLFVDGCRFDDSPRPRTREWIRRRSLEMRARCDASSHHISNIRLRSVDADQARASAYVYSWQRRRGGGDVEGWGRYETLFRLDRTRWKFAHHRIVVTGSRETDSAGVRASTERRSDDQP